MVSSVCVALSRFRSLESGRTKQWIEDSETEDRRPWATATVAPHTDVKTQLDDVRIACV